MFGDNMKDEITPAEGIVNEIQTILWLLRLPNFVLPEVDQVSPDPYEQIRFALMNIRKKLEKMQRGEYQ